MKVDEAMTRNAVCCNQSQSALTAASLMQQHAIGILPVSEGAFSRRLVGVVTDRDLCLQVIAYGRNPANVWIRECMSEAPACCRPEDDAARALELMQAYKVHRIPVVNDLYEIVGIISIVDLIRTKAVPDSVLLATLRVVDLPGAAEARDTLELQFVA